MVDLLSMTEAGHLARLLRLGSVICDKKVESKQKIKALMEVVKSELGLSCACLYSIENGQFNLFDYVAPLGNSPMDIMFPIHGSFAERFISVSDDVTLVNSINYPFPYHPLYTNSHPSIVIGSKLFSHGELIGILEFSSAFKRDAQRTKDDIFFVKLASSFISELVFAEMQAVLIKKLQQSEIEEIAYRKKEEEKTRSIENSVKNVAHEYNNVLVAIMGSCELGMADLLEDNQIKRRFILIQRSAQRAANLTEKLISFSGKTELDLVSVSLSSLLRKTITRMRESLKNNIRFEYQDSGNIPDLNLDIQRLQKIINGIIYNSIESISNKSGLISVFCEVVRIDKDYVFQCRGADSFCVGDYVCVKITDTGSGMSRELASRIFDTSLSIKPSSKGIPWSHVLDVVVAHGGAIDFSSTVGVGTTIKIFFPIISESVINENNMDEQGIRDSNDKLVDATVLVVDDEESVCLIAEEILCKTGYRTLQARNGKEAVELFQMFADDIAVAILGLTMPDMTGLEVYEKFRAIRSDIPVIISSGHKKGNILSEFAGRPYLDFVHKPFSHQELLDRVKFSIRKKFK